MVRPDDSNLIIEASVPMEMEKIVGKLALTKYHHLILPEVVQEAAEATLGKAINVMNPLKR